LENQTEDKVKVKEMIATARAVLGYDILEARLSRLGQSAPVYCTWKVISSKHSVELSDQWKALPDVRPAI
jgi:hypothetical protein